MKIAIAGVPNAGKTTLGKSIALAAGELRSTDSLSELGWSESSEAASKWFDDGESFVIEGVAVPRALRKWLKANPEGKPVESVIWLGAPKADVDDAQHAMGKGAFKVLKEIEPELRRRGVELDIRDPRLPRRGR